MNNTYYTVVFVYPDGHIEEIEERFSKSSDAKEYGDNLLGQVYNTEKFHGGFSDDKRDPYYMIVEVVGKKRNMVYDSKR